MHEDGAGVPVDKSGSEPGPVGTVAQARPLARLECTKGTSRRRRVSDFIPECDVCRSWSKEARDINTRYDGQREKRTKGPPPELSPSERAIAASHIKLWRACSGDSMTFILEDDVVFEADCAATIQDLVKKVPIQSASLLLLGYFHREEKDLSLADETALLDFKLPQYFWGAHAYGLTAPAAKVLLKRLPVDCPIDDFIAQAVREGVLHCYAARAKVAKQRTQDTSLVVHSGRANPNVTHNRSKKDVAIRSQMTYVKFYSGMFTW